MMNINENNELKGKISTENLSIAQGAVSGGSYDGAVSFKDELKKMTETNDTALLVDPSQFVAFNFEQLNPIADDSLINEALDVGETFKIDTKTIENNDAMFFLNISNNQETINLKLDNDTIIDASNYKTMEVSKTLSDLIVKAKGNNKAVRLDFDDHVTVVLKVSKEGKIDTTFIPQDKQVEQYLKNNIDYLKVRFDEQGIAYSNISYKPYRQNKNNKQRG